jgi:hypothetical protein
VFGGLMTLTASNPNQFLSTSASGGTRAGNDTDQDSDPDVGTRDVAFGSFGVSPIDTSRVLVISFDPISRIWSTAYSAGLCFGDIFNQANQQPQLRADLAQHVTCSITQIPVVQVFANAVATQYSSTWLSSWYRINTTVHPTPNPLGYDLIGIFRFRVDLKGQSTGEIISGDFVGFCDSSYLFATYDTLTDKWIVSGQLDQSSVNFPNVPPRQVSYQRPGTEDVDIHEAYWKRHQYTTSVFAASSASVTIHADAVWGVSQSHTLQDLEADSISETNFIIRE